MEWINEWIYEEYGRKDKRRIGWNEWMNEFMKNMGGRIREGEDGINKKGKEEKRKKQQIQERKWKEYWFDGSGGRGVEIG